MSVEVSAGNSSGGATGTVTAVGCHAAHAFSKPVADEIVLVAGVGVEGDAHAGVTVRHRSRVAADPTQPNVRQVHLIHRELFGEVAGEGFVVAPGELGENVTTSGVDLLGLPCGAVLRFGRPPGSSAAAGASADAQGAVAGVVGAAGASADAERAVAGVVGAAGASADAERAVAGVVAAAGRAKLDGPTTDAVAALVAAARRDAARRRAAVDRGEPLDDRPAVVITGLRNPCPQIDNFSRGLLKQVVYRDTGGRLVRKAGVMAVVLRGGPVRPGDPIGVELPPPPHLPLDRV